jgi:hypothetical protein
MMEGVLNTEKMSLNMKSYLAPMWAPERSYPERPPLLKPKLELPEEEIIRLLGGSSGARVSRSVERKMQTWKEHVDRVANPRITYTVQWIDSIRGSSLRLEDGARITSPKVARTLKQAEAVVCFVATIGNRIEGAIERLNEEGNVSDAYIVDAMGSVGVERAVEKFHLAMERVFRNQGKGVTLRFSPGYCDWPLNEQEKLFKLVQADLIGVTLSESCLMNPRKSVSGIFGITNDPSQTVSGHNPCARCNKRDCFSRRS